MIAPGRTLTVATETSGRVGGSPAKSIRSWDLSFKRPCKMEAYCAARRADGMCAHGRIGSQESTCCCGLQRTPNMWPKLQDRNLAASRRMQTCKGCGRG
eukprot:5139002-Pyramimonas_sp.AAC.1